MTASGGEYRIGQLARIAGGPILLAADGRYRLVGAPDLTGWDESDAIVWGERGGDSIRVAWIAEMMSPKELAEAALFVVRTHGRGARDHAAARLERAKAGGDVRDIEIWTAVLAHITGTKLSGGR